MPRISLFAALCLSAALAGCGSPVTSSKTQGPAFDPLNPGGGGDPVVGVDDNAGFFVKVTSDTARTLVVHRASGNFGDLSHDTTNFSQDCRILNSAVGADKDILCLAEIEELDLYFSELKVQYHLPRDMCHYAVSNPYHFFDMQPGTGPANISYTVDTDGSILSPVNVDGEGNPDCAYDYRKLDGPNCCIGNYTKTVTTNKVGGGTSTSITKGTWGGLISACLFGPAMDIQTDKTVNGFPKPSVYNVENVGLNRTYTIKAGINMSFLKFPVRSNLYASNFYNLSDDPSPTPLKPIGMRTASGYTPSDSYDFVCMDSAEEIKYRIRLMIREWNQSPIVEGGDPEVGGTAPDGTPINDRVDWKDVPIGSYPQDTYL